MPSFLNKPQVLGRECGGCVACCFSHAVTELKKAPRCACPHAIEGAGADSGCAIYPERPGTCRVFRCLWLQGVIGADAHRPDRLGVVFDQPNGAWHIQAHELRAGAFQEPRASYVIRKVSDVLPVVMIPFDIKADRRITGPRHLVARLVEEAKERIARESSDE